MNTAFIALGLTVGLLGIFAIVLAEMVDDYRNGGVW